MASKWLDAVAMKSVTAKAIAEATIEIILPLQILNDKEVQFNGKL